MTRSGFMHSWITKAIHRAEPGSARPAPCRGRCGDSVTIDKNDAVSQKSSIRKTRKPQTT